MINDKKIAVVIPCYRVIKQIKTVIERIPQEVDAIYIIDDCCDQGTGEYVSKNNTDTRVKVIFHKKNQGVGGAVISGYTEALLDGLDIVVKIDGDNQMDPSLIPKFVKPIATGSADYTKGNRFFYFSDSACMPKIRLMGNIGLSFLTKASSGYWKNFDPTNGYTAVSSSLLKIMPLGKINKRYFFESDVLFRLSLANAKVVDVPMRAVYEEEESNLHIRKVFFPFLKGNLKNLTKRIIYKYFLQDFNMASIELCFGMLLTTFGTVYGIINWFENALSDTPTPVGTIVISAISIIVGFQLLLSFLSYDISNYPNKAVSPILDKEVTLLDDKL